jgi:energy-coupling factor transport system permease protein
MKNIVIGRYIPGDSFIYRMDPRVKIIALILWFTAVFIIQEFLVMIGALIVVIGLLPLGRISIKRVYLGLRPLMFLLLFTFTFQIFFNRGGDLWIDIPVVYSWFTWSLVLGVVLMWFFTKRYIRFKLAYFLFVLASILIIFSQVTWVEPFATGAFQVYEDGLRLATFILLRLIIIVTLSTVLTITTKPTDLNLGLEAVLKPLKILRVNTEEIAMIISISLRYIPTLLDEANKIILAQASRGVDFQDGKFKDKVIQVISLLVPMFIISFQRSDELANAMEARGFVPGATRTRLNQLLWHQRDSWALTVSVAMVLLSISLRVIL